MNRSVTIFLCSAVVWAARLGETTEASLKRQESRQTEFNSSTRPALPEIVGDYVLIYKPQADVYTGKDTKNYKAGISSGDILGYPGDALPISAQLSAFDRRSPAGCLRGSDKTKLENKEPLRGAMLIDSSAALGMTN